MRVVESWSREVKEGSRGETCDHIKSLMADTQPFLIGRMPGNEANVLAEWVRNGSPHLPVITDGRVHKLEQNTGFYSEEHNKKEVLEFWCNAYLEALRDCDLLFRLETAAAAEMDFLVSDHLDEIHVWSAVRLETWMPSLNNKRVLVISPFEDSIKVQWEKRKELFLTGKSPFEFPDFELSTIQAPNTIKGNEPFPHANWRESFEHTCEQIDTKDFDIAILGCGSYGMPLAHYIKKSGKGAFYPGSYAQVMFGIKGNRWNIQGNTVHSYWNEFWKSPEPHEVPKNFQEVEGGCYWL